MATTKKIFAITLLILLTSSCNKRILTAIAEVNRQVGDLSKKVSKMDSTYNAQQLIFYQYGFEKIDSSYNNIDDDALLERIRKITGSKNKP